MARRIIMTGDEAQYIERRGANAQPDDDREIRMGVEFYSKPVNHSLSHDYKHLLTKYLLLVNVV